MGTADASMDLFDDACGFIRLDTSLVWLENDRLYRVSLTKAYLAARALILTASLFSSGKTSFLK